VQIGSRRESLSTVVAEGGLHEMGSAFISFRRADSAGVPARQRVYLSPRPDAAPALMHAVVRHLVDDPTGYPGVRSAKIAGPEVIRRRADGIVIYTSDWDAADAVVRWLREYEQANPGTFEDGTPLMTLEVMTGVAIGWDPPKYSFGRVRAEAVAAALAETLRDGGGWAEFRARARELLRAAGVDPDRPYANRSPTPSTRPTTPVASGSGTNP